MLTETTLNQGIKASLMRYAKGHCLRLVFSQDECRYASAGMDTRSQRKLRYHGTVSDGLLVWFDDQGVALRKTPNCEEPQLEGYINVNHIKGKSDSVPFIKPNYTRVREGDRPAFRLDPLPQFSVVSDEPFNPALTPPVTTPAEDAGRDILERFEEIRTGNGLTRETVLRVAQRLTSGDIFIGGERHPGDEEMKPLDQKGSQNGNGHRTGIAAVSAIEMREPAIFSVEDLPPEIEPGSMNEIKACMDMLNAELDKVDNRSLMLKIVGNRLKILRAKVEFEELV